VKESISGRGPLSLSLSLSLRLSFSLSFFVCVRTEWWPTESEDSAVGEMKREEEPRRKRKECEDMVSRRFWFINIF